MRPFTVHIRPCIYNAFDNTEHVFVINYVFLIAEAKPVFALAKPVFAFACSGRFLRIKLPGINNHPGIRLEIASKSPVSLASARGPGAGKF